MSFDHSLTVVMWWVRRKLEKGSGVDEVGEE
jgi:hypothetical protein